MDLLKHTFFINLESRKDRLNHVKNELKKLGIEGERFNAVKMNNGAIGCTLSHIKCLELAKERNYPQIFICEDDITFLKPKVLLESLHKFEKSENGKDWDVIIIGGNNCPPYINIDDYAIRVSNCQTTTGYIVNNNYYNTLISNFRESVKNLLKNPENVKEYAIDIYWKKLQFEDKWYMIIPATVIQKEDYSDIEQRQVDYKNLMLDIDKEWLFSRERLKAMMQPQFSTMKCYSRNI